MLQVLQETCCHSHNETEHQMVGHVKNSFHPRKKGPIKTILCETGNPSFGTTRDTQMITWTPSLHWVNASTTYELDAHNIPINLQMTKPEFEISLSLPHDIQPMEEHQFLTKIKTVFRGYSGIDIQ